MGFSIDCETVESTISSLCKGFNCSSSNLKRVLLSLNLEHIYETKRPLISADRYLYNFVFNTLGQHEELTSVYWFHFTRIAPNTTFHEGIIPLGDVLEKVWENLLNLPLESSCIHNLSIMKAEGVSDFQYILKTQDSIHWGPFGMLVKETMFTDGLSLHDYLGIPEIIEDICNGYYEKFKLSISDEVKKYLIPTTVKFKSDLRLDDDIIAVALYYAYSSYRNEPPDNLCVTCFDGEGEAIKPTDIESITTEYYTT